MHRTSIERAGEKMNHGSKIIDILTQEKAVVNTLLRGWHSQSAGKLANY